MSYLRGYIQELHMLATRMTSLGLLLVFGAAFASVLADNHTNDTCPVWHYLYKGRCKCGNNLHWAILCTRRHVYIRVNFGLSIWKHQTVAALARYVSYNYSTIPHQLRMYVQIPKHLSSNQTELEHFMCSGNKRKGFFCSQCIPNHGPSAYSAKCYKCDRSPASALALSLVIKLVPVFATFIFIATFRINITKGPMLGYIIYCQLYIVIAREGSQSYATLLAYSHLYRLIFKVAQILASVWSLDFLQLSGLVQHFCISNKLSNLDVLLLNFVQSVTFTFLIAIFTYLLIQSYMWNCRAVVLFWKPFHLCFGRVRRNFSASDKAIYAFASLWLLSFINLNYSAFDFTYSIDVYLPKPTKKAMTNVLYNDPNVHYYTKKYILYLTVVVTLLILFSAIPSLMLLLYPIKWFRKRLEHCCSNRCLTGVTIFINTFHVPFKDGSDGTRDYRMIPGVYTSLVLLLTILSCFVHANGYKTIPMCYIAFSWLTSIMCAYFQPFKHPSANKSVTFHSLWITAIGVLVNVWQDIFDLSTAVLASAFAFLLPVPHLLMFIWVSYKFGEKFGLWQKARFCFSSIVEKRMLAQQLSSSLLPDRLINSRDYLKYNCKNMSTSTVCSM